MKLIQDIQLLLETKEMLNVNAKFEMSASDVLEEVADILYELEQKYKRNEVKSTSTASAPDTTKFKAVKEGMIRAEENVVTHSYGGISKWRYFLKIGGAVDPSVVNQIHKDFSKELAQLVEGNEVGIQSTVIYCSDKKVIVSKIEGSAWGGIGVKANAFESSWRPGK